MNARSQRICAWAGILGIALFGVAIMPLAHFLPPPAPALDAPTIAAMYADNATGIRVASMVMLFCAALTVPFAAVISVQLKRIEGASAPFSLTQLGAGVIGAVLFVPPVINWSVAAFRPERSADLILLLNDQAWIYFVMNATFGIVQTLSIGFAIIGDRRSIPIFPRWLGYLNFWAAILFLPGLLVPMFKTGPFAWNGLLAFWLPASVFGGWFIVMFIMLLKAIARQEREG